MRELLDSEIEKIDNDFRTKIITMEDVISIIETYKDYFDDLYENYFTGRGYWDFWSSVAQHVVLSEEFMEKFEDRFNWYILSIHQKMSAEFIEKHFSKLCLHNLLNSKHILTEVKLQLSWIVNLNEIYKEHPLKDLIKTVRRKNLKNKRLLTLDEVEPYLIMEKLMR